MVILFTCWDRFDLRDSLGKVIITTLRQMHFVSYPLEASLFAVANFCIVGRANPRVLREASLLGSGERPVLARIDSVASRPLTTFGSPGG